MTLLNLLDKLRSTLAQLQRLYEQAHCSYDEQWMQWMQWMQWK